MSARDGCYGNLPAIKARALSASAWRAPSGSIAHLAASASATARTSAGSAGRLPFRQYGPSVSHKIRSGGIMAISWRPRVLRTIAGLTENHRPAASASSAMAAVPLYQWSTARQVAPASAATVSRAAPRLWTVRSLDWIWSWLSRASKAARWRRFSAVSVPGGKSRPTSPTQRASGSIRKNRPSCPGAAAARLPGCSPRATVTPGAGPSRVRSAAICIRVVGHGNHVNGRFRRGCEDPARVVVVVEVAVGVEKAGHESRPMISASLPRAPFCIHVRSSALPRRQTDKWSAWVPCGSGALRKTSLSGRSANTPLTTARRSAPRRSPVVSIRRGSVSASHGGFSVSQPTAARAALRMRHGKQYPQLPCSRCCIRAASGCEQDTVSFASCLRRPGLREPRSMSPFVEYP